MADVAEMPTSAQAAGEVISWHTLTADEVGRLKAKPNLLASLKNKP